MTAIFYPDCEATSANGKFTLEARSPHNGTIHHRNGRPPCENEFGFKYRQHQSEFRYRLIDNTRSPPLAQMFGHGEGTVVWERWQKNCEDSPHELVVSDDGWSILRTHGFRPEVITISPAGKESLRVQIGGPGVEHVARPDAVPICSWSPEFVECTTAGLYWTAHSWRCFFQHQSRSYFGWRTYRGERLLIDLEKAALVSEANASAPGQSVAVVEAEKQGVCAFLEAIASDMSEVCGFFVRIRQKDAEPEGTDPRVQLMTAAFHLVGVYRLEYMVPQLRNWEKADCPGVSMGSTAMPGNWLEQQHFRPILHHSLRLLGHEPLGFATYNFIDLRDNKGRRFSIPERIPDRAKRVDQLRQDMTAEQVLEFLGSPDHIKRWPRQIGKRYVWPENWEYDIRTGEQWSTFRITWEAEQRKGRIIQIETVPSYWLHSNERELEILRF